MKQKTINIELSQEQYNTLAQLVYIGSVVATSRDISEEEEAMFSEAEQYFYAQTKDQELESKVNYYPEFEEYNLTEEFEVKTQEIIEEYDSQIFWDSLCLRLAQRDLAKETGTKFLDQDPGIDILQKIIARSMVYSEEFEEDGLDRLYLKKK